MAQVLGYFVLACVAGLITFAMVRAASEDRAPRLQQRRTRLRVIVGTPKELPYSQSINAPKVIGLKR